MLQRLGDPYCNKDYIKMKQSVVEQHRGGMRLEYPVEKLMHAQKMKDLTFL